jgi:predicted MFS family arabinose efflux permease
MKLLAPKAFYFFWFVALGVISPFIVLYYRQAGLDAAQIGLLLAIPGITQIVAGPLWGLLADTLRLRRLLPVVILGTLLPTALIGLASGFLPIFLLAVAAALFSPAVSPLADSATLAALGDQRERYGAQRVWGAIGWGVSTVAAGWLVERSGLWVIFWAYPLMGALAVLAAIVMPRADLPAANLAGAARALLRDPRWARFLGCSILIGASGALVHGFLSLYLEDIGAGGEQIGLAYLIASLSELPVMALSPIVLRRWGARPLLIVSGLAYAIRMAIYGLAPFPEVALAAQLLHGFCFAAMWTAGVVEAQRLAPPGLAATAQGLFGTAVFGVAVAVANSIGGLIYRDYGFGALFFAAAILALAGSAGLTFARAEQPVPATG